MWRRVSSPDLVSRSRELRELERCFAVARGGEPQLVLLLGEAGIGKSRLLETVTRQAADAGDRVLLGHAISLGSGVQPFASVAEMVRQLLREEPTRSPGEVFGPSRRPLSWLVPGLAEGPDPRRGSQEVETATRRDLLFAAVVDLVDRLRSERPLVLAFEDLHWADPATLDLVRYLARTVREGPLLLVATLRSDPTSADPTFGELVAELTRLPHVTRCELPPLDRVGVEALIAGVAGDRPSREITERIATRSGQVHEAMAPHTTGGVYVNYLDADDADRVASAYGTHYRCLAEVKQRWDPDNLFRANHNIDPAASTAR